MDPLLAEIDPSVAEGDEELSGGCYKCRDNIANFRVKVRVRKVCHITSSSSLAAEEEEEDEPSSPASSTSSTWLGNVTLGWQEKLFSQSEENYYREAKEEEFQGNVLKKKFFRDVQEAKKRGKTLAQKIFTCLDGELYENDEDKILPPNGFRMTTNPEEEANYVSLLMADGLRRRHVDGPTLGPVYDKSTIPTQNVVNYAPTRENQLKLHTLNNVGQAMVIRFALDSTGSEEDASIYGEFVDLCVLKFGANGVLEVSPDFTNNRKPYTIELEHKKETYEYWIEHVSPAMDYDEQLRESVMQNEVFARHVQVLRSEVGDDFERPPGRSFRLFLNGEIVSTKDYDQYGSSLFVHYFLELPMGWSLAQEDGETSGLTQTCKIRSDEEVAHFGHPFCFDLFYDINRLDKKKDALPKWPQLFFEVISLDHWSTTRNEGYGYISLPVHPGSYDNLIVETWRPLMPGPLTEMKRYFIGGTPELEDLSYCGNSLANDARILSRYGFRTVSSGTIKLRMNVVHQAKALSLTNNDKSSRWKRHHLMDRLASATLFSSLTAVMEAFKKARERIAKATVGYDTKIASIPESEQED